MPGAIATSIGKQSFPDKIAKSQHRINAVLSAAGTIWIFFLMLIICADVIGLKIFASPLYGVIEFTEHSIVPIVFLQLAAAVSGGRITRADFLFQRFSTDHPRAAALLDGAFMLAGAGIFGALTVQLWQEAWSAYQSSDYLGTRGVFTLPSWPFHCLTLLGASAVTAEFLREMAVKLFAAQSGPGPTTGIGISLAVLLAVAVALVLIVLLDPSRLVVGCIAVGVLLFLLLAGMPVMLVLMLVGLGGVWLIRDNPSIAVSALKSAATGSINKFDFGVVPLFVLMGLFTDISQIGRDAYRVAAWWTRNLLGGLGIATVLANTIFASVTGISIASAAIFSRVAVPQMVSHGHTRRFAAGVVAGTSVLGMLIPPSLLLILYGFVAEVSVGQLFVAAVLPGVLLAVLFCGTILLLAKFMPGFSGVAGDANDLEPETLLSSARRLFPIVVMVLLVLGGIYLGWFTPTQAGAVGAFVALVITALRGCLTRSNLWMVLRESGQITVSVLILVIGASVFSKALVMSTLPMEMVEWVTTSGFGFYGVVIISVLIAVVMGMFLDSTSILVILVPISLPLVTELGLPILGADTAIWYGIVIIVAIEMGLLTPPFGISVFVVTATIGDGCRVGEVFAGALPYVLAMALLVALIIAFPALVTVAL